MSKKLEEKQQRRLAEEAKKEAARKAARKRSLTTLALAVVVTAGVVFLVVRDRQAREGPDGGNVGVAAEQAGCDEIQEYDEQGRDHIDVGAQHEEYNSSPPTSGPHYASPAQTGFYPPDGAPPPEQLVHNLEHGQIVIWYRPDIAESAIDALESIANDQIASTVVAPYDDIEASFSYAVTGWTASMTCAQVSEAAINEFRREYQGRAPEPLTPPFTG